MSCTNCNSEKPCEECKATPTKFDVSNIDSCICDIISKSTDAYTCALTKGIITPVEFQNFIENINIYSSVHYDETTGTYVQGIITQPTLIVALTLTNATCFGLTDGTAAAVISGGTAPYVLEWKDLLDVVVDPANLAAGAYKLIVTDANNVTKLLTFNITEPAEIAVAISTTDETSAGANDGTATATPSLGVEPYTYLWSDAQTTQTATGLAPGVYSVTVTDDNGCIKVVNGITINAGA